MQSPLLDSPIVLAEHNKRLTRRKSAKRGVIAQCRRGQMGLGADLACCIVDISDGGACLIVKQAFRQGEDAEIILFGVGRSKPVKLACEVRSCVAVDETEETFKVGFRFRKRIPYAELDNLC